MGTWKKGESPFPQITSETTEGSKKFLPHLANPLPQKGCLRWARKAPLNRLPSARPVLRELTAFVTLPLPPHRFHPTSPEAQLLVERGAEEEEEEGW